MLNKKKLLSISVFIIVVISIIIAYLLLEEKIPEEPNAGYIDIYYLVEIKNNHMDQYTIYLPFPRNSEDRNMPHPAFYDLEINGSVSCAIFNSSVPNGISMTLAVNGTGNVTLKYIKRFYWNNSYERISIREYQIDRLLLLKDSSTGYVYYNSSDNNLCELTLKASHCEIYNEDVYQCSWETSENTQISLGWNEIELLYYCDPDV